MMMMMIGLLSGLETKIIVIIIIIIITHTHTHTHTHIYDFKILCDIYIYLSLSLGHKERLEHIYWECRRFECNSFGMGQSKWLIISKINQTFECIPSTKFCQILSNWVLITYQPVVDLLIINNNLTSW